LSCDARGLPERPPRKPLLLSAYVKPSRTVDTLSGAVTTTAFAPAVPVGVGHASSVGEMIWTGSQGRSSTVTVVPGVQAVPRPCKWMMVPPDVGPLFGSA
jgi:hypothetical protein